jgi:Protein kinase domain
VPLASGDRLGPYRIVASIGAGGMGEVYRARDTRLDRDVAIKVLADDLAASPDALARFSRETRSVAALNHPNILAIYDVGAEGAVTYAVTELLAGETLRACLDRGPLPPRRAVELAVQMAAGLGAAHERGIVHCDLKPENVFLTSDGRLKVLDFGLARRDARLTPGDGLTQAVTSPGIVMGTPGYISPERLTGEPATAQSDVFAFGVVLHEMLTGRNPFRRASATETITAILRDDAPALGRDVEAILPAIGRIVARCLEKRPEDRLRSVVDLGFYLEAVGSSPIPPDRPAAGGTAVPSGTLADLRRRVLVLSGTTLLVLCAAIWAYVQWQAHGTVTRAVEADLASATRLVVREHEERLARLTLSARVVASLPQLRDVLLTNAATVADFLKTFQQDMPDVPLLMALGRDGTLLGHTDHPAVSATETAEGWLGHLGGRDGRRGIVASGPRLLHAALASAEVGGTLYGYVVAAAPVDESFARALRAATRDEIVLLGPSGLLASTLRAEPPWRTLDAWRQLGPDDRARDLAIGTQRFGVRGVRLTEAPPLVAIVSTSRDEAAAPFRRIQAGLLFIGSGALALVALGALLLARLRRTAGDQRL